jgi:Flp pilus assembly protein protease CpaA
MAGVATVTVALFFSGVVTGVIVVVALAIRREDRRYSLVREAPDRMSRSARRLTGVGRRGLDAEFFPVTRELVH